MFETESSFGKFPARPLNDWIHHSLLSDPNWLKKRQAIGSKARQTNKQTNTQSDHIVTISRTPIVAVRLFVNVYRRAHIEIRTHTRYTNTSRSSRCQRRSLIIFKQKKFQRFSSIQNIIIYSSETHLFFIWVLYTGRCSSVSFSSILTIFSVWLWMCGFVRCTLVVKQQAVVTANTQIQVQINLTP